MTGVPQRPGDFATLADALDYAARSTSCIHFYSPRGDLERRMPYSELAALARDMARRMGSLGLQRGDRLGLIAETGPEFFIAFYACQYVGLTPCPLPLTLYMGGRDAYVDQITQMSRTARLSVLLAPQAILPFAQQAAERIGARALAYAELAGAPASGEPQRFSPDDVAYIQYSSGSTSDPRGVLVTQKAVAANVEGILRHGMKIRPDDRTFCWLPLHHDMGLVGFAIASMSCQLNVDYFAPSSFARRPLVWLELMNANRTSITYAPGFAYRLLAERFHGDPASLDLSRLRVAGIGGDMVRLDALDAFAERFAPSGFRREAFLPSYGLAEATLAVTFIELDEAPRLHQAPDGRNYVECGRPLPGIELVVVDEAGEPVADGETGAVRVRGTNVMKEYFNDPAATASAFDQRGFLDTGDLGCMVGGRLVITGRRKDLILHRGRNIWPQDVERIAEAVASLRGGDAAAVSVENNGEEQLVLLVQCGKQDAAEREALRKRLVAAVSEAMGVIARVEFVPPRSLPHTTSGKLARARAGAMFINGQFPALDDTTAQTESGPSSDDRN